MTIGLILFTLVIVAFSVSAYWTLYQVTLAAWRSSKAKPYWLAFFASPIGKFFTPVGKWLLPTAAIAFVVSILIQLFGGAHAI